LATLCHRSFPPPDHPRRISNHRSTEQQHDRHNAPPNPSDDSDKRSVPVHSENEDGHCNEQEGHGDDPNSLRRSHPQSGGSGGFTSRRAAAPSAGRPRHPSADLRLWLMSAAVDRIRPKNWLDAFGFVIQVIAVLMLIGLGVKLIGLIQSGGDGWPWFTLASVGSLALSAIGYIIRRVARHEPVFDKVRPKR
jgi:hypothetical protein